MTRVWIGIFVGGASSRMGGAPKGLLPAPDGGTLAARLVGVCRQACPDAELCTVGASEPYRELGLRALSDEPRNIGPIGGMAALLRTASAASAELALAIACDLPFLNERVVARLAWPERGAAAWVPEVGGHLQPLCAAYAPAACLPALDAVLARGQRSMMSLIDELGPRVERLALAAADEPLLRDWDTPADVSGG